ncbi:MAG: DUF5106 domain-containing protein [Muribaculaceae bacterium]|nr:DUF5106 domain-containing protein [Muribaculaceae bacterium]
MKKRIFGILRQALFLAAAGIICTAASGQTSPIVIEPLFEYPVAPENIESLEGKSGYLVTHFWDSMNFKEKQSVDQNALNDAFAVYVAPMRWAPEVAANASADQLISQIAKNPVLSLQFAKAAEEALYGPRAEYWNDALYIKFLDNVEKCKGISKDRKLRYKRIRQQLSSTLRGTMPPEFDYHRPDGTTAHYHPNGIITIIEFGDPDCDDCRLAKLKMDTDIQLSQLIDKGMINVLFINVDPDEGWESKLKDYPSKWHVGASDSVSDLYDLRATPSIYVIDKEGKVAAKNVPVRTAIEIAVAAAQ